MRVGLLRFAGKGAATPFSLDGVGGVGRVGMLEGRKNFL